MGQLGSIIAILTVLLWATTQPLKAQDHKLLSPPNNVGVKIDDDDQAWLNIMETGGKHFIKLHLYSEGKWVETQELLALLDEGMEFLDMTDAKDYVYHHENHSFPIPKKLRNKPLVFALQKKIDSERMREFMTRFTQFHTRFYWTDEGQKAAEWLLTEVRKIVERNRHINVTVWDKKDVWKQRSVFARIEGMSDRVKHQIIIVGAHLDSVNSTCFHDPTKPCREMRSPGANDNASGTSVILETFRILLESGFVPKRSIEFHFYSAEEIGSRGSLSVALDYMKRNLSVVGYLNFDTAGYAPTEESKRIAIQTKDTDDTLTEFVRRVVATYASVGWINKNFCAKCYSDFASWVEADFPTADVHQETDLPLIHTMYDTVDHIDFPYLAEFVKVCLGYLVEYAQPLKVAVKSLLAEGFNSTTVTSPVHRRKW